MTARRPRTTRKGRAAPPPRTEAATPATDRIKLELEIHREELATQNEDLRRANAALATANERYALLYDRAPVGYFTLAAEGTLIEVNMAGAALIGTPRQFLFGRPFEELISASARAAFRTFHTSALETSTPTAHESVLVTVRGPLPVRIEAAPLAGGRHSSGECVLCVTDESQRREVEAQRLRAQARVAEADRVQSLGTLAAGIAHDFNNILAIVLSRAELLLFEEETNDVVLEHAREIRDAVTRAASLSQQMLSYAGQGPVRFVRLDLSQLVRSTSEVLTRLAPAGSLHIELADGLGGIDADPAQIGQILVNLVTNAAEAIGPGGNIMVRTRADDGDGRRVVLEVVDDGRGMDRETRLRAFDPFFTTKFAGRGLGLAVVHGNAQKHGATVTIDSRPHVATTVRVSFPSAGPTVGVANDVKSEPTQANALVLIVDDEAGVRTVTSRILSRVGYRTVDASSGYEALGILQAPPGRIAAVLLDLTMPELDGAETLARIRASSQVPVLLMSGYASDQIDPKVLALANGFITKPFTLIAVRQALAAVLSGDENGK